MGTKLVHYKTRVVEVQVQQRTKSHVVSFGHAGQALVALLLMYKYKVRIKSTETVLVSELLRQKSAIQGKRITRYEIGKRLLATRTQG